MKNISSVQITIGCTFMILWLHSTGYKKNRTLSLDTALSSLQKSGWMTHSMPFLKGCRQLLEDTAIDVNGMQINETFSNVTENPLSSTSSASSISTSRGSNDNAYFYILFVMVFYSFLAMTLFKCFGSDEEKKDPYEEFMSTGKQSTQKFNTGHMEEKFDFEEESNL